MKKNSNKHLRVCTLILLLVFGVVNSVKGATPQELFAKHLYFDSIAELEKMLVKQSVNSEETHNIKYILGLNYFRLGSLYDKLFFHAAFFEKKYYEKIAEDVPNIDQNPRLMFFKGMCCYALREFDESIELFNNVVTLENDNLNVARAQMWKDAAIICKKGDSKSNEDWNRLFTGVTQSICVDALFLRHIEQKYQKSDINFTVDNINKDVFTLRSLVSFYSLNNDLEKAKELLTNIDFDKPVEAIQIEGGASIKLYDPFLLKAFSNMAFTQAIVLFEECIISGINRESMHPGYWLGRSYLELGQLSDAISILSKEDKYLQASIFLGEAYWKNGERANAREIWKKLVKKTENPILLRELAYTYERLKVTIDNTEALARKALNLKKSKDRRRLALQPYYGCLGYILFNQKKIEDAIEEYGNGFLFDQKHTVEANDPEYILEYSKAIFIPDVLSYDLINQSMLTLSKAYKGALQLRNAMSGIYLITYKNMEGGKLRDGM